MKNYYIAATRSAVALVFLLAMLIAPSFSVPLRVRKRGAWHNPCGNSARMDTASSTNSPPARHEVAKLLKVIRTQLGIATKYFKKELKNINTTYSQVGELKEELYRYDWLPQKQLQWYKDHARCLKTPQRVEKVLQLLHMSLQNFSVTFQELQKPDKPEIYPESTSRIRKKVIGGMAEHLNQVLCEVEWAIYSLDITIPERIKDDMLFLRPDKWNQNPDATGSLIQDWGVISLYKNFLVDWYRIMERVNKNTSCKNDGNKKKKKPKK